MDAVRTPPPDAAPAAAQIAELWWVLALRGGVAIALGAIALLWPVTALLTLVLLFATYNVVEALASIVVAVRGARNRRRWWWSALHALVALAAAVVAVLFPAITMVVFVILLTAWALVNGVLAIVAAFSVERAHGRGWLIASGIASLVLAALLMAWPPVGLFTLAWMFAFYALAAGISMLGLARQLRAMRSRSEQDGDRVEREPPISG
jgi:uncharacterized membrane protein HdeD (DUF308 family)